MHENIEKEFKILVNKEQFYKLLEYYPTIEFQKQVNTYYDNSQHEIIKSHGAMRIREKNGYTFTLKKHCEKGLMEYECPVDGNSSTVFKKKEIKALLDSYNIHGPFLELCSLTTKRAMYITDYAELCFDISEYNGYKDYEIEYEFKKEHDGLTIFQSILNKIGLTYSNNCASKIKRALDTL